MSGLPQLICQIATEADFRAHFQADPRRAAAARGLTLSEEEWATLEEVKYFCRSEGCDQLSDTIPFAWWPLSNRKASGLV